MRLHVITLTDRGGEYFQRLDHTGGIVSTARITEAFTFPTSGMALDYLRLTPRMTGIKARIEYVEQDHSYPSRQTVSVQTNFIPLEWQRVGECPFCKERSSTCTMTGGTEPGCAHFKFFHDDYSQALFERD